VKLPPELAPVFVRAHTRVKHARPRGEREPSHPTTWANFALVFDCETTTDLRQDLTFLWWRFCELKEGGYVCQREGVVYADTFDAASINVIQTLASGKRAHVEDGCPEDILVQSRTTFVDGEFWNALRMGAVIVAFNAPFDLSRLALEFPKAQPIRSTESREASQTLEEPWAIASRSRCPDRTTLSATYRPRPASA